MTVFATYRKLYDVVIPDLTISPQIDCRDGCPVNTDARGYMIAIHAGNFWKVIRSLEGLILLLPFVAVICGAPCETTCREIVWIKLSRSVLKNAISTNGLD